MAREEVGPDGARRDTRPAQSKQSTTRRKHSIWTYLGSWLNERTEMGRHVFTRLTRQRGQRGMTRNTRDESPIVRFSTCKGCASRSLARTIARRVANSETPSTPARQARNPVWDSETRDKEKGASRKGAPCSVCARGVFLVTRQAAER